MKRKMKNRLFHLNIHNIYIFHYFYWKVQLDTLETMLFNIKINVMLDFSKNVFIWAYECLIFGEKTTQH